MKTPLLGVFTTNDEPPLMFEFLQGLYGMGKVDRIVSRAKTFGTIPVIDPVFLLVAKANSLGGLDQDGRQDEKHLRMMVIIVRCYLSDLLAEVGGQVRERDLIKEFKLMQELLSDRLAAKGLVAIGTSIGDCLPMEQLRACDHAKLQRFIEQAF